MYSKLYLLNCTKTKATRLCSKSSQTPVHTALKELLISSFLCVTCSWKQQYFTFTLRFSKYFIVVQLFKIWFGMQFLWDEESAKHKAWREFKPVNLIIKNQKHRTHVFCFLNSVVKGKFWQKDAEAACLGIILYRLTQRPHWHLLETPGKGIEKKQHRVFPKCFEKACCLHQRWSVSEEQRGAPVPFKKTFLIYSQECSQRSYGSLKTQTFPSHWIFTLKTRWATASVSVFVLSSAYCSQGSASIYHCSCALKQPF